MFGDDWDTEEAGAFGFGGQRIRVGCDEDTGFTTDTAGDAQPQCFGSLGEFSSAMPHLASEHYAVAGAEHEPSRCHRSVST